MPHVLQQAAVALPPLHCRSGANRRRWAADPGLHGCKRHAVSMAVSLCRNAVRQRGCGRFGGCVERVAAELRCCCVEAFSKRATTACCDQMSADTLDPWDALATAEWRRQRGTAFTYLPPVGHYMPLCSLPVHLDLQNRQIHHGAESKARCVIASASRPTDHKHCRPPHRRKLPHLPSFMRVLTVGWPAASGYKQLEKKLWTVREKAGAKVEEH